MELYQMPILWRSQESRILDGQLRPDPELNCGVTVNHHTTMPSNSIWIWIMAATSHDPDNQ